MKVLWIGTRALGVPPLGVLPGGLGGGRDWALDCAGSIPEAAARLEVCDYSAVVLECPSSTPSSAPSCTPSCAPSCTWIQGEGGAALEQLLDAHPVVPVVVWGEGIPAAAAVRWVRAGAFDVAGPEDDLESVVEAAVEYWTSQPGRGDRATVESSSGWRGLLVGDSRAMQRTAETIRLVGPRRSTVLITGETGTGKELLARAIHQAGPRAHLAMITVNAAALPEHLLEAELFGHVKGAFTGAIQPRVGRFEQAHRSTLFLDEIGDLPLEVQTKLLRFLQQREFERIGSSETLHVDVRLIAATNVDLLERVRQGRFREDLYYRLNVVPVVTPPLREHLEDIPALTRHFIEKICRQEDLPLRQAGPETLARLRAYAWPGNVRQLENAVERAVALSGDRTLLLPHDFPLAAPVPRSLSATSGSPTIAVPDAGFDFDQTVGHIELQILEEALRKTGGNKTAAAGLLGLKRTTLAAKLRSLGAAAG
jgi:DNA-binding NtrC family response regulator